MAHPRLTGTQSAVLFVLMSQAREVPNPELKTLGPDLKLTDRNKLVAAGLIEVDTSRRPMTLALTDTGWSWCTEELTQAPPDRATPQIKALYSVLGGLGRHLHASDRRLYEIFTPAGFSTPISTVIPSPPLDTESAIRSVYSRLAPGRAAWVPLATIRAALAEVPAADVDAALLSLERQPGVNLIPQEDQALLSAADRDAAVTVGTQRCHLLSIA